MFQGSQYVVGCPCGKTAELAGFIENYAAELTTYLRHYWKAKKQAAIQAIGDTNEKLGMLDGAPDW
jgi:hypothetical protein